jgi:hypothetical protein
MPIYMAGGGNSGMDPATFWPLYIYYDPDDTFAALVHAGILAQIFAFNSLSVYARFS